MTSVGMQRWSEAMARGSGRDTAGGAAAPTQRRIGRRAELPSRRALAGALLVTGAAALTFVAAGGDRERPGRPFVVAGRDLAPGAVLGPDDVTTVVIDLPAGVAASAFGDPAALHRAVTLGPVAAGALLTTATVGLAADGEAAAPMAGGYREVSFAVPRARALLGSLAVGDRIDVLASIDTRTEVLAQHVLVLATSSASDRSLVVADDVVLTVALDNPADALAVAHGASVGELTVLRSTRAADRLADRFPTTGRTGP